jgi:hypothetical protein
MSQTQTQKQLNPPIPAAKCVEILRVGKAKGSYEGIYVVDWEKARQSSGCWYINHFLVNPDTGERHGLRNVVFRDEVHSGAIGPNTDVEVARINAENPKFPTALRDKDPQLHVRKYRVEVETEEDGITLKKDVNGDPIFPDPEHLSPLYEFGELMQEAFKAEILRAKAAGLYITDEEYTDLKLAGKPVPKVPIAANPKISSVVQMMISKLSQKNAGALLPNSSFRAKIQEDKKKGIFPKTEFFDKLKSDITGDNPHFERAKVDNDPINSDNIHLWITPRSIHDGFLDIGSVCFSNLAISMPLKVTKLISEQRVYETIAVNELYAAFDPPAAATAPAAETLPPIKEDPTGEQTVAAATGGSTADLDDVVNSLIM